MFKLLVCLLAFVCVNHVQTHEHLHNAEWDLLLYTQRWPITVCKDWKEKNETHTCFLPNNFDTWTVHGIWPTRLGSIGPQFCNRTWHFDPDAVKPIKDELIQEWTNVEGDTSTYSFWAHEWNKHGTCAAVLDNLNSQIKYFTQGLNWLKSYSMLDILSESGIVPSNEQDYPLISIHNAIKQKLGVNPVIECRREQKHNYLFELRICFNKQLQLEDCDGVIGYSYLYINDGDKIITNCDRNQNIRYLKDMDSFILPPKSYLVQLYHFTNWLQWATL